MKKFFTQKRFSALRATETVKQASTTIRTATYAVVFFAIIAGVSMTAARAQKLIYPVRVSSISAQPSGNGTVITMTADGPINRAQTWQDDEGYHVVLPDTVSADSLKLARGVRIRRVGSSLEVLVQTTPGARVNAVTTSNELKLAVDGKLVARPTDSKFRVETTPEERQLFEDPQYGKQPDASALRLPSTVDDLTSSARVDSTTTTTTTTNELGTTATAPQTQAGSTQIVPQGDGSKAPEPPPSAITVHDGEESLVASVFSGTSVFIVLGLGLFGLLVSRKLRSKQKLQTVAVAERDEREAVEQLEERIGAADDGPKSLVRASDVNRNGSRQAVARMPVAGPTSLYGAYRIDQEVCKLILGQAHRIDVIASRAIDDRRAIETSLIKSVNSPELDESARRRAREALEEYGFVARQCAALLLAPDAFDRMSAARSLGEIKSAAALPFLLESLYDAEPIVRNQAVMSIGELKLPSAIGALLDIARTHPDVPSGLLSRTLSACSVEGLDFFDAIVPESTLLETGEIGSVIEQITHLEPAAPVENLPDSAGDEGLATALAALESIDAAERAEALKALVQYRVQSAVDAIAKVARHDTEPSVRSLAISSLGLISHESVFPTVVIGMADEAREVRAAAARSLNRLSFDRADAYVRVLETGDTETIRNVAKACVHSGIVSQNLDRLTSSDHRQAYETFSLISLLARAQMNEPVLHAIAEHPRTDARLKAIHLLACTGEPEVADQLRQLALNDNIGETVKTALLDTLYRLEKPEPSDPEIVDHGFVLNHEHVQPFETTFAEPMEAPVETEGAFTFNTVASSTDFAFQESTAVLAEVETENQPNLDEYEL